MIDLLLPVGYILLVLAGDLSFRLYVADLARCAGGRAFAAVIWSFSRRQMTGEVVRVCFVLRLKDFERVNVRCVEGP
jgi:hypothetical protein